MSRFNLIAGIATFGVWWVLLLILKTYQWIFIRVPARSWRAFRNVGSYKTVTYYKR